MKQLFRNLVDQHQQRRSSSENINIALSAYDLAGATRVLGPWKEVFKRAQSPSEEEVQRNRRARSAKLRVAERRMDGEKHQNSDIVTSSKYKKVGNKQLEKMRAKET